MQNTLTISGIGRKIRGVPTPAHPTGVFLKPKGWQGWEGLPAGRREALARALTHGEHDVPVKLPARVMTADCWLLEKTLPMHRELSQRFTGWGASGDRFLLSVDHQGEKLTAIVRRILAEADDTGRRNAHLFVSEGQIQFLAADPRKYGDTLTLPETGGTATTIAVYHRGNFLAFPVVEIPAAPAGYTITTSAGVFTVAGATPGGTHRVDLRTGRVTRNGVWMPDVGRGPLWAAPDGDPTEITLSVPGRVLITNTFV